MERTLAHLEYPETYEQARDVLEVPKTATEETLQLEDVPQITPLAQAAIDTLHQGDVLDRLRNLRQFPDISRSVYCGTLAVVSTAAYSLSPSPLAALVAWVAGGSAPTLIDSAKRRLPRKQYQQEINRIEAVQEQTTVPIELFRRKTKTGSYELDVRLYDTGKALPVGELVDTLANTEQAAKEAGAMWITLPRSLVSTYLDEELAERCVNEPSWLNSLGKLPGRRSVTNSYDLRTKTHAKVVSVTPDELKKLTEQIIESEQYNTLPTVVEWLRRVMPHHPAVEVYDKLQADPNIDEQVSVQAMSDVFTRSIERRLDNVVTEKVELTPGQGRVHRQKHYLAPVLLADKGTGQTLVNWRKPGQSVSSETTDLLAEHNITVEQLQSLITRVDSLPANQLVQLCELVGWMHLNGVLRLPVWSAIQSTGQNAAENNSAEHGLQARFLAKYLAPKRSERKTAEISREKLLAPSDLLKAALMIGCLAVPITIKETNKYTADVLNRANDGQTAINDRPSTAERYTALTWDKTRHLVDDYAYDPLESLWDNVTHSIKPEQHITIDSDGDSSVTADLSGEVTMSVEGRGSNQPVWQIEPTAGMSSEGYWSQDVNTGVGNDGAGKLLAYGGFPDDPSIPRAQIVKLEDSEKPGSTDPSLRVTAGKNSFDQVRKGVAGDFLYSAENIPANYPHIDPQGSYIRFDVPVLTGTRIAGVEATGVRQSFMLADSTGQQHILVEPLPGQQANLTSYYLVPDNDAAVPKKITDVIQNDISNNEITEAWKNSTGVSLSDKKELRLQESEAWIRQNFTYDLAPIEDATILSNLYNFVVGVLATERVKCDTASILLTLTNPYTVSPTVGYLNSNTPEQEKNNRFYLGTREAHMWTVDKDGDIHDPTPPSKDPKVAKFFTEDFANVRLEPVKPSSPPDFSGPVKGTAAIAGAAVVIGQRRRISRVLHNTKVRSGRLYARLALATRSDQGLIWAHSGYNFAQSHQGTGDYRRPLPKDGRLPFSDNPAADALESLRWRSTFPTSVNKLSRRQLKQYPTDLRRDVKVAERVIRHLQRVDKPLRPKK